MKLYPTSVRSRLTLWYVGVLAVLLLAYGAGSFFYLLLSMRHQMDHNLLEDKETVEGQIVTKPGGLTVQSHHGEEGEPSVRRFIEIWTPDGKLLYRTAQLQGQALGAPPVLGEKLKRNEFASVVLSNGLRVRVVTSFHHMENGLIVIRVGHNEESMGRELNEFGTVLAIGFPLGVFLAGIGGYALAHKALAPISAMARETKKISAEDLAARLSIRNPQDELGQLGAVFNNMLSRLQQAFERLRRFTADASHELRTPLTAMRSVGEVALQDGKTAAEYRDVIGSMLEEVDHLTRLVESLLVLSRADAGHVRLNREEVSLVSVAQEAVSVLEVLAEEKRQTVAVTGEPSLAVFADRLILRQAIVNLLDNAIKYSPPDSRILVRAGEGEADEVFLEIIDRGPGIPIEHQPYVFDRFYRVDEARTREWGGTGLGLSITRWAVEAHDGDVTLKSQEGSGSVFRVSLPLARKPAQS